MKLVHALVSGEANNGDYISSTAWNESHAPTYALERKFLEDDFIPPGTGKGNQGHLTWNYTLVGTGGASAGNLGPGANNCGEKEWFTGSGTNDYTVFHGGSTSSSRNVHSDDVDELAWVVRLPLITSTAVLLGITNGPTSKTPSAGVWFKFDPSVSANWECKTGNGTNTDTQGSGVSVSANTWYLLRAYRSGSDWKMRVNAGTELTFNTYLPDEVCLWHGTVHTTTTALRSVIVDYASLGLVLSAARY